MKSLQDVKNLRDLIVEDLDQISSVHQKRLYGRKVKEYNYLKEIELYLQFDPSEDFLRKQVRELENRLDLIMVGAPVSSFLIDAYLKLWQVEKIKKQIAALKFILN